MNSHQADAANTLAATQPSGPLSSPPAAACPEPAAPPAALPGRAAPHHPKRESSPCHFIPFIPSSLQLRSALPHLSFALDVLGFHPGLPSVKPQTVLTPRVARSHCNAIPSSSEAAAGSWAAPSHMQHPAEPSKSQQRRRCWRFCSGFLLQHRGSTAESGSDNFLSSPRVQLLLCSASPSTGTTKIIHRLLPTSKASKG